MSFSSSSDFLKNLKERNFEDVLEGVLRDESSKSAKTQIDACVQLYLNLAKEQKPDQAESDDHLEKLETLLKNKPTKLTAANLAKFPKIEKMERRTCAGKYESCYKNEITEEQLRFFRKPTEDRPERTLTQSSIGNFLRAPREPQSTLKDSSMGKFLRAPREPQSTLKDSSMGNFLRASREKPSTLKDSSRGNFLRAPRDQAPPVQEVKPVGQSQHFCGFRTAREELRLQQKLKYGHAEQSQPESNNTNHSNPSSQTRGKSLGMRHYIKPSPPKPAEEPPQDERLAHIEPRMVELIENEIMKKQEPVSWDDIAGLEYAKSVIEEIVIASLLRPDLYKGLRRPPRGVLLFGPPGTGKTLIGRCIASQSNSTFFSISSSSITSKYVGESEKMVRALFAVAAVHQPAVIFIDEIDSMLCKRSENDQDHTRRLKNEFLVQLDGATTSEDDRIVVIGATNRPQELDDAARRRLVRRLYIPLPDARARIEMIKNLLTKVKHNLTLSDIEDAANLTDGYSCADLKSVLHEAALKPLRGIPYKELISCTEDRVRAVNKSDIRASLRTVRPTVAKADIEPYLEWNKLYGTVREDEFNDAEDEDAEKE